MSPVDSIIAIAKIVRQLSTTGGIGIDIQVKGKDEASNRERASMGCRVQILTRSPSRDHSRPDSIPRRCNNRISAEGQASGEARG